MLDKRRQAHGRVSYTSLAEVVSALDLAKAELLRRWLPVVEDSAIARNGDLTITPEV